jgi:hypothetical protein
MTEPTTAADDAAYLRQLADVLDPGVEVMVTQRSQLITPDRLRDIAAHLDRIASGGDADTAAEVAHRVEHPDG